MNPTEPNNQKPTSIAEQVSKSYDPTNQTQVDPQALADQLIKAQSQTPGSSKTPLVIGAVIAIVILLVVLSFTIKVKPSVKTPSTTKTAVVTKTVALAPVSIAITDTGFNPLDVTVKVNQGIIWTNHDSAEHGVVIDSSGGSETAGLNTRQSLSNGETFDYIFTQAGNYSYHDPSSNFKGEIEVTN